MTDRTIGRYTVIRILGEGAMGVVYEARDPHLDRKVAIKTIRHHDLTPALMEAYERRFLTEARSVARLNHPHIVRVFDAGQSGSDTFLVMEYVQGINLKHCLRYGVQFTPAGAARILVDVLDAVGHAHGQKIIHRDIKPENILMDAAGTLKLTDFGIAKIMDDEVDNGTQLTGKSIGTPRYMSPEQVRGKPIDERSDVFSAGVLLYELLTALQPFDGEHHMAIASQILHDDPPLPSTLATGIPPALDAVVQKALAKRPDDRYQNAAEFRADVFRATATMPETVGMVSTATQYVRPEFADTLRHLLLPVQVAGTLPGATGSSDPTVPMESATVPPRPAPGTPSDGTMFVPPQGGAGAPPPRATSTGTRTRPVGAADSAPPAAVTRIARGPLPWPWLVGAGLVVVLLVLFLLFKPSAPAPARASTAVTDPAQSLSAKEELVTGSSAAAQAALLEQAATNAAAASAGANANAQAGSAAESAAAVVSPVPPKAPSKPLSTKHSKDAAAAAAAAAASAAVVVPTPLPEVPKPTVQPTPVQAASPPPAPAEPCQGMPFLARESCLWDACYTDTYRRHPVCKRFANEGK